MDNKNNTLAEEEIRKILRIFKEDETFNIRPHFFVTGPSGSGKTFTIEKLCREQELKILVINAAQITKEGASGASLSKLLSPLAKDEKYADGKIVVFVDEFDKLFISDNSNNSKANDVTIGVQNEFLKVLDSNFTDVFDDFGKYKRTFIKRCLFVFAGAFNNTPNIDVARLLRFGVKIEFLGRVGHIYNLHPAGVEGLFNILENSELLESYLKIQEFSWMNREDVINDLKHLILISYQYNIIGARLVNHLIEKYFIRNGDLQFNDIKDMLVEERVII